MLTQLKRLTKKRKEKERRGKKRKEKTINTRIKPHNI